MGKDFTCQTCTKSFRSARAFKCHICRGKSPIIKSEPEDDLCDEAEDDHIKSEPQDFLEISQNFDEEGVGDSDNNFDRPLAIKDELEKSDTELSIPDDPLALAEAAVDPLKYQCSVCKEVFETEAGRGKHLCKAHASVKPFSCPICKKSFLQKHYVTLHMRIHSGERPYKCHLCPRTYSHRTSYTIHMRIHNGDRPYACLMCGKRCYDKSGLTSHMRSHTKETPYECHICHRKFTHSKSLLVHKRNHTGEKPYVCRYCNKAFRHWHKHKIHTRLHTGERPYKCKICGKGFPRNDEVNRHMKSHQGIKSFRCSICGVFCATQASITGHIVLHHSALKEGDPPAKTMILDSSSGILGYTPNNSKRMLSNVVNQSQIVTDIMKSVGDDSKPKQGTTKVIEITSKETPLDFPKRKLMPKPSTSLQQSVDEKAPTHLLNYKEFVEWQEKMLTKQGLVVKGLPPESSKSDDTKELNNKGVKALSSTIDNIKKSVQAQGSQRPPQFLLLSQQTPDGTIQKVLVPISTPVQTTTSNEAGSSTTVKSAQQPLLMLSHGSQKMLLMPPSNTKLDESLNKSIKQEPKDPESELSVQIKEEKLTPPSSPMADTFFEPIKIKKEPKD